MKKTMLILAFLISLSGTVFAANDANFVGISNYIGSKAGEIGGLNDSLKEYIDLTISRDKELGLKNIREGIFLWYPVGDNNWKAQDYIVDKYLEAGINPHMYLTPTLVDQYKDPVNWGAWWRDKNNMKQWQEDYRQYCRSVINHYKGKVNYYLVFNEPSLFTYRDSEGNTKYYLEPEELVEFLKILYEEAKAVDPNIMVESPSVQRPHSLPYLEKLLDAGEAEYCDYIGFHAYGGQVMDGTLDAVWKSLAKRGIKKPLALSESGTSKNWFNGENISKDEYLKRWYSFMYMQAKRYGIDHVLFFDLDGTGEQPWGILDENGNPRGSYDEFHDGMNDLPLANGGFEEKNNPYREWIPYYNIDADMVNPYPYVNLINNDAENAHSGNGYLSLDAYSARHDENQNIYDTQKIRRIAGQLTPGHEYEITGYVKILPSDNNAVTPKAQLKALGYDKLDGDSETAAAVYETNEWKRLSLKIRPSNPWTVIELNGSGDAKILWDDIEITDNGEVPTVGISKIKYLYGEDYFPNLTDGNKYGQAAINDINFYWETHMEVILDNVYTNVKGLKLYGEPNTKEGMWVRRADPITGDWFEVLYNDQVYFNEFGEAYVPFSFQSSTRKDMDRFIIRFNRFGQENPPPLKLSEIEVISYSPDEERINPIARVDVNNYKNYTGLADGDYNQKANTSWVHKDNINEKGNNSLIIPKGNVLELGIHFAPSDVGEKYWADNITAIRLHVPPGSVDTKTPFLVFVRDNDNNYYHHRDIFSEDTTPGYFDENGIMDIPLHYTNDKPIRLSDLTLIFGGWDLSADYEIPLSEIELLSDYSPKIEIYNSKNEPVNEFSAGEEISLHGYLFDKESVENPIFVLALYELNKLISVSVAENSVLSVGDNNSPIGQYTSESVMSNYYISDSIKLPNDLKNITVKAFAVDNKLKSITQTTIIRKDEN